MSRTGNGEQVAGGGHHVAPAAAESVASVASVAGERGPLAMEAISLGRDFRITRGETLHAVREVSFNLYRGAVVALVGEEATVKRFFQETDHVRLQPENESMEPIRSRDVRVIGKVVGLMRNIA